MSHSDLNLRVLDGPVNVGNQAWTLSRAERALGVRGDVVVLQDAWPHYPADRFLERKGGGRFAGHLGRIAFGMASPFRYDVLHYYFGRSYVHRPDGPFRFVDLQLARRAGRKVFMTLQGCDVRLAAESDARHEVTMCREGACGLYRSCVDRQDDVRRTLVAEALPHCDRVFVLNPDLAAYAPGAVFLPYASCPVHETAFVTPVWSRRPVVLHAPTDPGIKGTGAILAALDALREEFDFEVETVQGVPHAEAMRRYRSAHLVVDQVRAGWYGGFAVELMAMGKPVASFVREEDLWIVPDAMRRELPVLRIREPTLVEDLRSILTRRDEWTSIGAASRRFAERWHDPRRIARAMANAYADSASAFHLDPGN